MLVRLLFFFLVTPIVELALLVKLGDIIGFWPTVAIIVVTGVTGSYLAKREGLSAWKRLQNKFSQGGVPGKELLDGVIILVAGALLLTPGVLTDLIGFSGLFPPTRALIRRYVKRRFKRAVENGRIQTRWGGFDMSPPPSAASTASEQNEEEDEEPDWGGESRRVPRHADEIDEGDTADGEER